MAGRGGMKSPAPDPGRQWAPPPEALRGNTSSHTGDEFSSQLRILLPVIPDRS